LDKTWRRALPPWRGASLDQQEHPEQSVESARVAGRRGQQLLMKKTAAAGDDVEATNGVARRR
jgi:hypothetical protein